MSRYTRSQGHLKKGHLVNLTEALDVSSRIHLAKVLLPEQVAREQSSLKQRPNLPPYLIHTSLPDDVVTRLEGQRDAPLLPRFTVFPLPCGPCWP